MNKPSTKNYLYSNSLEAGFTIVELVVAIVISSILAVGTVAYIGRTVEGVDSASRRNKLASTGRVAIDRVALELHNALPNSIRVADITVGGGECIEYVPVLGATTYINPAFSTPNVSNFTVVDFIDGATVTIPASATGIFGVIFPRNTNSLYRDGSNTPVRSTIHSISSIVDIAAPPLVENLTTINLGAAGRYRRRSPNERFFVVGQPVSFCVVGDKLYRYSNYDFIENQSVTELPVSNICPVSAPDGCLSNYNTAPDKTLIVDSISNTGLTAFTVGNQNLSRNSLVAIQLNMQSGDDTVLLKHEVLTRSVP